MLGALLAARRPRSFRLRVLTAVVGLGALSSLSGSASADIFTYTDAEGVVHFANKPKGDGRFQVYIKSAAASKRAGRKTATASSASRSHVQVTRHATGGRATANDARMNAE